MVRKHFYLISYILDISLFGHECHVFCTELQGCMLILHFTTLPEKRIHYRKGKERDVSVRGYMALPPFLTLILIQQLTQSSSLITDTS